LNKESNNLLNISQDVIKVSESGGTVNSNNRFRVGLQVSSPNNKHNIDLQFNFGDKYFHRSQTSLNSETVPSRHATNTKNRD